MLSERGQTLLELIVVIAVVVMVVGALVFATIASLRNAQFAKNQAQATKLAQEGIERVRSIRDRDSIIRTAIPDIEEAEFSKLYTKNLSLDHCNATAGKCYLYFTTSTIPVLTQGTPVNSELIGNFKRQILIEDQTSSFTDQKTVTVVVKWTDFSGTHESRLTTILRKI